ncbi:MULTISPECIES: DUF4148 domain-containing protein [Paraburkholderia]|uniref:Uncharacterized protein DUF4148 n=1 Tax=Paraburkholderia tropica TaxID=92647 RepID=A0A1A5XMB4_9BURK|nr:MULTISPECIES: DUF4148 domain-containing protein [Paraburkholderia]MBB2978358.1 hypothetical protein [Paraburkholderia tropica]MBB2998551.1 hypothetical protein [Paraburkholderia tropica]MBB6318674.1 hypothetical protein [Paraburkholderia tropica]MDE1139647.1 DUF4148 domain-containing protein [Paraburkholderia tropica]OBR54562.1 hypothetical protein A6456_13665 [Paraburkholderia tropica]
MNTVTRAAVGVFAAACCFASLPASAQSYNPAQPMTRAQVRADLAEWRAAGYDPLDWIDYPENAQRAGAIVAQRRAAHAAGVMPQSAQ